MKKKLFIVFFFACMTYLFSCEKDTGSITICGNRCASSTPWRVESLDLGLPCFATQAACRTWADTHGYNGEACVLCN